MAPVDPLRVSAGQPSRWAHAALDPLEHRIADLALHDAQKAIGWMLENPGYAFPYSFVEVSRIVGVELESVGRLAPV